MPRKTTIIKQRTEIKTSDQIWPISTQCRYHPAGRYSKLYVAYCCGVKIIAATFLHQNYLMSKWIFWVGFIKTLFTKSFIRDMADGIILCCVVLCCAVLCYAMLCYVMLCYIMLCHVMSCHIMSCHVMLQISLQPNTQRVFGLFSLLCGRRLSFRYG